MWEHQLSAATSFKFGPYYNEASNIFENYVPQTFSCNAATPPVCGFSNVPGAQGLFTNSGVRKAFGLELGINHLDNRPVGLSWWVSGTYDNFWTNSVSSLTTPYGSVSLPPSTSGVLLRSSADPPLSGTFTAELNEGNLHIIPQLYLQSAVTYYTGTVYPATGGITAFANRSTGWGIINGTISFDVGRRKDITIGIQGENILNNTRPITPCSTPTASQQAAYFTPEGLGLGCQSYLGEYDPIGGNGLGVNGYGSNYANLNQSTPLFFIFISKKL